MPALYRANSLLGKSERHGAAWANRAHFFFAAARAMRDILVERARRRASRGRAESAHADELDADVELGTGEVAGAELLLLDAALSRLASTDDRKHSVVMLRHFAGLTLEQTAELLGVDERTVRRDWRFARAWLAERMAEQGRDASGGLS
jgi:RNA polymerase sigma factor (TIGR02999 family)